MNTRNRMTQSILVLSGIGLLVASLVGSGCLPGMLAVDAGEDMTIDINQILTMSGKGLGGAPPYVYAWTPTDGLSDPTIAEPLFSPTVVGDHTYTLTVTDTAGQAESDDVTITVTTTNDPVVAEAGDAKSTAVAQSVTLDGAATGGDEDYAYAWSPTTGLNDATVAQPVYTPTAAGETTFTLTVTDGEGVVATDTVLVTVDEATSLSSLTWGADKTAQYVVEIVFDTALDEATAETVQNYRINGTTQTPTSATLGADAKTVTLAFAGPLPANSGIDISVDSAIRDTNGNRVTELSDRSPQTNAADTTAPSVASLIWAIDYVGSYQVIVEFSEVLDQTSAETTTAYRVTGSATRALTATLQSDGTTVLLVFDNITLSSDSAIDISLGGNIKDVNGNAMSASINQTVDVNTDDDRAPEVVSIEHAANYSGNGYAVEILFDEALSADDVETPSGYRIGGTTASSASLSDDARTVTAIFELAIDTGDDLDVSVGNRVRDINGNSLTFMDDQTIESSSSDSTRPAVNAIAWAANYAGGGYQMTVTFNESVDRSTAADVTNYEITGTSVDPTTAALATDGKVVTLTFTNVLLSTDTELDVSIDTSIKDINGNTMTEAIGNTIVANAETNVPIVASLEWEADYAAGGYKMIVGFPEAMDETTAETLANYRINGTATTATTAVLANDAQTVALTFTTLALTTAATLDVSVGGTITDINGRAVVESLSLAIDATGSPTAPTIASVMYGNGLTEYAIIIEYSQAMDETTVEALANYDINNGDNIAPDTATLAADGLTATLTWTASLTQPWAIADTMDVSIASAITDINAAAVVAVAGQAISANPADTTPPTTPAPTHVAASNDVVLVFNEVLDEATVEAAAFATSKGGVALNTAALAADGRTVTLNFDADPGDGAGSETLTIPNTILDINGNAFVAATPAIPN